MTTTVFTDASTDNPRSEGRNRTLGLRALNGIQVPVPGFKLKCWFDGVYHSVEVGRQEQDDVLREVDTMLPAVQERAFCGSL